MVRTLLIRSANRMIAILEHIGILLKSQGRSVRPLGRSKVARVAAFFMPLLFLVPSPAWAAVLHVSVYTGEDSPACGPASFPCKTIWQGIQNAGAGNNVIKIAQGQYVEYNQINTPVAGLTLQGGWDNSFTVHTCDPTLTILRPNSPSIEVMALIADAGETIGVTLACLDFQGPTDKGLQITASGAAAVINLTMQNTIVESFTTHGMYLMALTGGEINADMTETVFQYNQQTSNTGQGGAGLRADASSGSIDLALRKSQVLHNECFVAGGGILLQVVEGDIVATVENTIIAGNQGLVGGGLESSAVFGINGTITLTLINTTISDNLAALQGGGLSVKSDATRVAANLRNTIIWGNTSNIGTGNDIYLEEHPWPGDTTTQVNAGYSIVGDVHVQSGNYAGGTSLNVDPRLDDRHHLAPGSPAIDAGLCGFSFSINSTWVYFRIAPYDDIDGDKRPGYGENMGCDIGADEFKSMLCFPVKNKAGGITMICM